MLTACMFRAEWWRKAVKLLPDPAQRCAFYDAVFARSFDEPLPHELPATAQIMLEMLTDFIDADKVAYEARCERNRQNARGKREGASGCDSLQVGSNTTPNTNPNTINNPMPLSKGEEDENKEKFLIIGIFFSRGSVAPLEEAKRFWDYYAALGWKNSRGASIIDKRAAARSWRLQLDSRGAEDWRTKWHKCFQSAPITDARIWTHIRHVEVYERRLVVYVADLKADAELMENECLACLKEALRSFDADQIDYTNKPLSLQIV